MHFSGIEKVDQEGEVGLCLCLAEYIYGLQNEIQKIHLSVL